jgi:hypothetical protein
MIALAAFVAGAMVAPLVTALSDREPEGSRLSCVAYGRVCVGMRAEQAMSSSAEDNFGGPLDVGCGFDRPGSGVNFHMSLAEVVSGGCSRNRYVASFSDGRHLTNVRIDNGAVVELDRFPRHALDL